MPRETTALRSHAASTALRLGERLRQLRVAAGLTQSATARIVEARTVDDIITPNS